MSEHVHMAAAGSRMPPAHTSPLPLHRRFGGAVFETVEVHNGHTIALTHHLELLVRAASVVGLPEPDERQIEAATIELILRWGDSPGRLRITWSGQGSLHLFLAPLVVPTGPARVVLAEHPMDSASALCGLKTSGMTANIATLAAYPEADEVLLPSIGGEVIEGCSSNFFVVVDDTLVTPPLTSGCRAGVTRSLVLEAAAAQGIPLLERSIDTASLQDIGEAFLTSTGRHVQRVESLDGRRLRVDGHLTASISSAFDLILAGYSA